MTNQMRLCDKTLLLGYYNINFKSNPRRSGHWQFDWDQQVSIIVWKYLGLGFASSSAPNIFSQIQFKSPLLYVDADKV